jgi:predicted lysophospholipase L1 biosynthesis ABC-type transport system permease subunit
VLEVALPYQSFEQAPMTMGEVMSSTSQSRAELVNVTDVIIVASLLIAGCSLAVGVTAGVSDRKRPFSLLRLTGVPVGVLRRVVALEAALPLLLAAVLSAATGLLGAELFLRSQLSVSLRWPGLLYVVVVLAGIVVSIGLIVSTFPLIARITGPETARSE